MGAESCTEFACFFPYSTTVLPPSKTERQMAGEEERNKKSRLKERLKDNQITNDSDRTTERVKK